MDKAVKFLSICLVICVLLVCFTAWRINAEKHSAETQKLDIEAQKIEKDRYFVSDRYWILDKWSGTTYYILPELNGSGIVQKIELPNGDSLPK